jgi:hypothetical protein
MNQPKFVLSVLPEKLGICHFDKSSPVPEWAANISFCSITRTKDELSIVCSQDKIPGGVMYEKDWRSFKVEGPLGFVSTGIVSSLSSSLSGAGISIFYISTYETDYVLVEDKNLEKAKNILGGFCDIK